MIQLGAVLTSTNITWYWIHYFCLFMKDTPYLALMGELWGVYFEDF